MTCFIVFFRCCFILYVATEGRFKGDFFVGGFLELIVFFLFFFRGWGDDVLSHLARCVVIKILSN